MRLRNWKKLTEEAWAVATSPLPRNWGGGSATPRPPSPAFWRPSQERGRGWHRGGPSRSGRALKGPASPPPHLRGRGRQRSPLAGQLGARRVPPRSRQSSPGGEAGGAGAGAGPGRERGRASRRPPLPPLEPPPGSRSRLPLGGRVQLCSISGPGASPAPWNRPSSPTRSGRRSRADRRAFARGAAFSPRSQRPGKLGLGGPAEETEDLPAGLRNPGPAPPGWLPWAAWITQ